MSNFVSLIFPSRDFVIHHRFSMLIYVRNSSVHRIQIFKYVLIRILLFSKPFNSIISVIDNKTNPNVYPIIKDSSRAPVVEQTS